MFVEVDVVSAFLSSTSGYIAERQKQKTDSHCESVLFRNLLLVPSNKQL